MPHRFALVDHSIKEYGGHHAEYARRVASAVRELGYPVVLGVARSEAGLDFDGHETIRVFRHSFWENQQERTAYPVFWMAKSLRLIRRRTRHLVTSSLITLRYSWVGLAMLRGRDISSP